MGKNLDDCGCMTEHDWTRSPHDASDNSRTGLVSREATDGGARRAPAERLESFFAQISFGIILLDGTLRIELANPALFAVIGVPESDLVGQSLESAMPHIARALIPVANQVLATGDGVPELSFSASPPNDEATIRSWVATVSPIARDSATVGVGIAIRDVTHRARARERDERRLRHREGLYALTAALVETTTPQEVVQATLTHAKAAFNAAGVVIARCTPDGGYLEILDAYGMPPDVAEEWRRFPTEAPVPLAYVARTGESLFLQSAADWEQHFPELAGLASDVGHSANIVVPLTLDPKPIGALGIAFQAMRGFDDEDRAVAQIIGRHCALALERARLLEAERAARAEAVTANRVKTKFMATMNHELRTPLNAIAGYTELLQMGIQGPLTDGQRDALARIQRNLQHLLGLIGSILSLMKAESGQQEYSVGEVAIDTVLQFVAEATAPQLAAKQLHLEQEGTRGCVVMADAEKLRQILLNLFSNAIKFTEPGGRLTTVCSVAAGRVSLAVRDTGLGIPPDELEHIFDAFVQVGHRLSQPTEGTGLGLAISREFARGMGGDLSAQSELGLGSTFVLALPTAGDSLK